MRERTDFAGRKQCLRDSGWRGRSPSLSPPWRRRNIPLKVESSHYKLAFENESVQVVNVHYGPHEKSGLHAHPGGVVVTLTKGHLRFTDEQGKTHEVFAKPGESRWFPPFTHKVENLGDTSYNAVYIGIKKAKTD